MKTQSDMIVTHLELMDDEESIDAGLVLVTAEVVRNEPVTSVQFLANIRDGFWISREVTVTVEWENSEDDDERSSNEHVLQRGFSADQLSPEDFTAESVDEAPIQEGGNGA